MSSSPFAVEVFCSYVHADKRWLRQLEKHLSALKRQGLISLWHDRHIYPGTDWAQAIDEHLESASIILLLISADFIDSDYCYGTEMKRALERHEANQARVIPIVVRPCDWQHLPIGKLQALPVDGEPISTWALVDEGWTQVVTELRVLLKDLPLLSVSAPRNILPKIWMISYPRNPFFLGRDELLSQIHTQLHEGHAFPLLQPQAICGLGGVGKTQIAIEYAYRYSQEYQVVLWAHAENIESLTSSYVQLAAELNLPEKDAQDQKVVIQAVKTWLHSYRNWLFILDNADEMTLLRDFLPPAMVGHLLITTRASATGQLARRIEVETFTDEQGALFLLRRASLLAPDGQLSQAPEQDQTVAQAIAKELGGLPLALDQAGAYLEQTGFSSLDYQQIYQHHREYLLSIRGGLVADHQESVSTTWALSFARVEQKSRLAADVLRLCAFLAADAIPLTMMTEGTEPVVQDRLILGQIIETLRAYSLVSHDSTAKTLSIHQLVQVVIRDQMSIETRRQWAERTLQVVNMCCPDLQVVSQWRACEQWLPHAIACVEWILQERVKGSDNAELLYKIGHYLEHRGHYGLAESFLQSALAISEQELGITHPDTSIYRTALWRNYYEQKEYAKAEILLQHAIVTHEEELGVTHLNTATSLNDLAIFYIYRRRYAEAEPLLQRALTIREQQLGTAHLDTATSLNDLAGLYIYQEKYMEAEPLLQRALIIREQQLGTSHSDTARSLNNLAGLYQNQGRYAEAEPLLQRALANCEQQLQTTHLETISHFYNLALFYVYQKRYTEAELLLERQLAIYEQQLGATHPDTAQCLILLAKLYCTQERKYAEAEPLLQRALTICEQQLGVTHPDTIANLDELAIFYIAQRRYTEAEPLLQRVLIICEQQLGQQHPTTQKVQKDYTSILQTLKREARRERWKKIFDLFPQ